MALRSSDPVSSARDFRSQIAANKFKFGGVEWDEGKGKPVSRTTKKPPGWEHLFEVPGQKWEDQTEDLKAMHVTLSGKHVVVYAYKKAAEFNVVTYFENTYTDPSKDKTLWVGPMEALCIILECLKEANASTPLSSSSGI